MQFRHERVRIETARHEIEGTLQLPHEGFRSRLTDFLNTQSDEFLPLTDAEVTWLDDAREPEHHEYLALATRHVVIVVELGTLGMVDEPAVAQRVSAAARRLTASSTSSGVVPTFSRAKPAPGAPKSSPRVQRHAPALEERRRRIVAEPGRAAVEPREEARLRAAPPRERRRQQRRQQRVVGARSSRASRPATRRRRGTPPRPRSRRGSPRGQRSVVRQPLDLRRRTTNASFSAGRLNAFDAA